MRARAGVQRRVIRVTKQQLEATLETLARISETEDLDGGERDALAQVRSKLWTILDERELRNKAQWPASSGGCSRPPPYNGFSAWTRFGNQGVIAENDPAEQEKSVKWNSLLCNLIVFHTAIDMMEVIRQLVAEGWQVTAEDLAQLSPYLTSHILRFGAYATDELHIPPDVLDPALDEVDFGGEQPAAA
jgi:hypothetical protein